MIRSDWVVADATARNALATTWADVLLGNECFVQSTSSIYRAVRSGSGASIWRASDVESEFDADEVNTALAGTDLLLVKTAAGSYVTALLSRVATYVASANNVTSGTWTPTMTLTTNLDAITPSTGMYVRVGSIVVAGCKMSIDATSAAAIEFEFTLPVTTNFSDSTQLIGTVMGAVNSARVFSDAADDRAVAFATATSGAAVDGGILVVYRVI